MNDFSRFISVFLISVFLISLSSLAVAQEAPPVFTESFYLMPIDPEIALATTLQSCSQSFARPLMNSGIFIERNTVQISEIVSDCVSDIASSTATRECELAIASSDVDLIFFFEAIEVETGILFIVSARSPARNAGVWAGDIVQNGSDQRLIAREACGNLGEQFLQSRGFENEQTDTSNVSTLDGSSEGIHSGLLEVMNVHPSPVSVYIAGNEIGTAPNQFAGIEIGELEVELRALGYQPYVETVLFESGEMHTLNNIHLEPLPSTILLTSNIHDAMLTVDGNLLETRTILDSQVSFEVSPNSSTLVISREGYAPFTVDLALSPGSTTRYNVELALRPTGAGNTVIFTSRSENHNYTVEIQTNTGVYRCERPISYGYPCTILGLPERIEVLVSGDKTFRRSVRLDPGTSRVDIDHHSSTLFWGSAVIALAGAGLTAYAFTLPTDSTEEESSQETLGTFGLVIFGYSAYYFFHALTLGPSRLVRAEHLIPPVEINPYASNNLFSFGGFHIHDFGFSIDDQYIFLRGVW